MGTGTRSGICARPQGLRLRREGHTGVEQGAGERGRAEQPAAAGRIHRHVSGRNAGRERVCRQERRGQVHPALRADGGVSGGPCRCGGKPCAGNGRCAVRQQRRQRKRPCGQRIRPEAGKGEIRYGVTFEHAGQGSGRACGDRAESPGRKRQRPVCCRQESCPDRRRRGRCF